MIKAILFDFGQTLVDSADGFRAAETIAKEKIFLEREIIISTVSARSARR